MTALLIILDSILPCGIFKGEGKLKVGRKEGNWLMRRLQNRSPVCMMEGRRALSVFPLFDIILHTMQQLLIP